MGGDYRGDRNLMVKNSTAIQSSGGAFKCSPGGARTRIASTIPLQRYGFSAAYFDSIVDGNEIIICGTKDGYCPSIERWLIYNDVDSGAIGATRVTRNEYRLTSKRAFSRMYQDGDGFILWSPSDDTGSAVQINLLTGILTNSANLGAGCVSVDSDLAIVDDDLFAITGMPNKLGSYYYLFEGQGDPDPTKCRFVKYDNSGSVISESAYGVVVGDVETPAINAYRIYPMTVPGSGFIFGIKIIYKGYSGWHAYLVIMQWDGTIVFEDTAEYLTPPPPFPDSPTTLHMSSPNTYLGSVFSTGLHLSGYQKTHTVGAVGYDPIKAYALNTWLHDCTGSGFLTGTYSSPNIIHDPDDSSGYLMVSESFSASDECNITRYDSAFNQGASTDILPFILDDLVTSPGTEYKFTIGGIQSVNGLIVIFGSIGYYTLWGALWDDISGFIFVYDEVSEQHKIVTTITSLMA